jgi:hypothetical protein
MSETPEVLDTPEDIPMDAIVPTTPVMLGQSYG